MLAEILQYPAYLSTNRRSILCMKGVLVMERLIQFVKEEDGVTAIEYGLIAALIALQ